MKKKVIILMAAAGLVSFSGAFVFAWLKAGAPPDQGSVERGPNEQTFADHATGEPTEGEVGTIGMLGTGEGRMKKAMTEQQLKSLVHEVRESIQAYNDKVQGLEAWERRLQIAQATLKKDIENLTNLQVELASMTASLRSEREKLAKTRAEIAAAEKSNLMSLAAAYDKMDATSAGKILASMCVSGDPQGKKWPGVGQGSSMDDAVKILYYMTERTKANLLADLVTSEPKLAAVLCQRLKQIVEEK